MIANSLKFAAILLVLGCDSTSQKPTTTIAPTALQKDDHVAQVIEWAEAFGTSVVMTGIEYKIGRTDIFVDDEYVEKGRHIPKAEEILLDLLAKRDARLHPELAVTALGLVGSEKSVPVLAELINDEELRFFAVTSLERLALPTCAGPLAQVLVHDSPRKTDRYYAVQGLAKIANHEAIDALVQTLHDVRTEERQIVEALRNARQRNFDKAQTILEELNTWDRDELGDYREVE